MKRWLQILIVAGLLVSGLACLGSGGGDAETPAATTAPIQATTAPVQATPEVRLGAGQRVEEGGFSFRPVSDYDIQTFGSMVNMLAPGADPDIGPTILLFGDTRLAMTTEELMAELRSEGIDLAMAENMPVTIAGLPGLAADLSGPRGVEMLKGRVYVLMVTPTQQFSMFAGGPESAWEELELLTEAVLASVEFFEPVVPPPTSFVEPGWYSFTNPNVARDVLVYDGVVYVAALGGAMLWEVSPTLEDGFPTLYTTLNGLGHVSAHSLAVCDVPVAGGERAPHIIFGTQTGMSFYDPLTGEWDVAPITPEESNVHTNKVDIMYCDVANNRLLIGYSGLGILDLETGAWTRFTDKEGLSWNAISDIAVVGRDIWVASGYNGISRISGNQVMVFNEDNGLPSNRANTFAVGADGALWVGTSSGLAKFQGNQWTFYAARDVSELYDIRKLVFAADGTLWVGTASLGGGNLCRFDPVAGVCVENYPVSQGVLGLALYHTGIPVFVNSTGLHALVEGEIIAHTFDGVMPASNFVDSFAAAPDGMLWVGTDAGIHRLDPSYPGMDWENYTREEGVGGGSSAWATALAVAPDGTVWAAITNGDASRYRDGKWTSYEGLRSYDSVVVDAQGRAWFGDDGKGIVVLNADGSQALELTAANGLPSDSVLALLADGDTVWIGTNSGIARYVNGQVELVIAKDDLPHSYVRDLALDANGHLLIGATLSIVRYDGAQLEVVYNFQQEGFRDWLNLLAVAPDGTIWAGTQNGLFHSADGATWERLTTADGLHSNHITALYVDQFGATWVGGGSNFSGGGLLHIVP